MNNLHFINLKLKKLIIHSLIGIGVFSSVFASNSIDSSNPIESTASNPKVNIKFATEATYPPFATLDAKGNIGGFETELVKLICNKANLNCEFQHKPFDSLFPSLEFKKIDAVYGCVGITETRKDKVLFSEPLYTVPVGFIFKDKTTLPEVKIIGIQKGTPGFEAYLKKHYTDAQLKTYASIQEALLDLKNNRIQAVFGDIPVFKYWEKNMNVIGYQYAALSKNEILEFSAGNAIAVRKDEKALIEKINAAFDIIVKEGSLKKLEEAYLK